MEEVVKLGVDDVDVISKVSAIYKRLLPIVGYIEPYSRIEHITSYLRNVRYIADMINHHLALSPNNYKSCYCTDYVLRVMVRFHRLALDTRISDVLKCKSNEDILLIIDTINEHREEIEWFMDMKLKTNDCLTNVTRLMYGYGEVDEDVM